MLDVLGGRHRPKPLAQVALIETRSLRELGGRHRPGIRQCREDAEAIADVHQPPAHRGSDVEHDPLDECFELLLVKLHLSSHFASPFRGSSLGVLTVPWLRGDNAKRTRNLRESA